MTESTDARMEAHEELAKERWEGHKELHAGEKELAHEKWDGHEDQHESIAKSLTEYKAQSNEWRGSLSDLRGNLAPLSRVESIESEVDRLRDELRALIATEREERRATEGVKRGMSQTTGIIVAAIGVAATIISVVVILANLAT